MVKTFSRNCRFTGCKNTSNSEGFHFYRFPKEEQRCQAWVKASQNDKLVGIPALQLYAKAMLCMEHFEDWCFMNVVTKHRLVHNAVPCSSKSEATKELVVDKICDLDEMSISDNQDSNLVPQLSPVPLQPKTVSENVCSVKVSNLHNSSPQNTSQISPVTTVLCTVPKSPVSRRKYTPTEQALASKVKKYRNMLRRVTLKFESLKRKKSDSLKEILLRKGVSEKLSAFIQRQVELNTQKTSGKRFTESDKKQAYRIYSRSRDAYLVLREVLELPGERTLQRFALSKSSHKNTNKQITKNG